MAKAEDQPKPTTADLIDAAKNDVMEAAHAVVVSWRNPDDSGDDFDARMTALEKATHMLAWLKAKTS